MPFDVVSVGYVAALTILEAKRLNIQPKAMQKAFAPTLVALLHSFQLPTPRIVLPEPN
jgi:hypothetical protein